MHDCRSCRRKTMWDIFWLARKDQPRGMATKWRNRSLYLAFHHVSLCLCTITTTYCIRIYNHWHRLSLHIENTSKWNTACNTSNREHKFWFLGEKKHRLPGRQSSLVLSKAGMWEKSISFFSLPESNVHPKFWKLHAEYQHKFLTTYQATLTFKHIHEN